MGLWRREPAGSPPARVKSPCVGVCVMDQETGYCEGCLRTLAEIAACGACSNEEREAILSALDARARERHAPGR